MHSYIFTELCNGGDLLSYLQIQSLTIPEADCAIIIFQVLQGVKYLHGKGIVHRDLKLENVLMTSLDPKSRVVITDFSWAGEVKREISQHGTVHTQRINSVVGTYGYCAP
jgi:serine/threonine protein kinase